MEMVPPWAKKGRTRRSGSTPSTPAVSTAPPTSAVSEPKRTSLLTRALVTGRPEAAASDSAAARSEERRVGKECRSRWSPEQEKKKEKASTERDVRGSSGRRYVIE